MAKISTKQPTNTPEKFVIIILDDNGEFMDVVSMAFTTEEEAAAYYEKEAKSGFFDYDNGCLIVQMQAYYFPEKTLVRKPV